MSSSSSSPPIPGSPAGVRRLEAKDYYYEAISDYAAADKEAAAVELRRMIDAGELNPLMTVVKGGELLPAAFASLFQSAKHVGKLVVQMSS